MGLEAEAPGLRHGRAAGGVDHGIHLERAAAGDEMQAAGRALDALDPGLAPQADAVALDLDGEVLAQVLLEAAQGQVAAQDEGRVRAQRVEDAGELEADIAGPHHGEPAREGIDVLQDLVGSPGELDARQLGQGRAGAHGHEHLRGRDLLLADADDEGLAVAARGELGAGREEAHAGALEHAEIDAVEARDLGVPGLAQPLEGELGRADVPAVELGRLEPFGEMRAVVHQLLGHAAADDAGPAHPAVLGQAHLRAVGRRPPPAGHAARAAADHEQVEVGHGERSPSGAGAV